MQTWVLRGIDIWPYVGPTWSHHVGPTLIPRAKLRLADVDCQRWANEANVDHLYLAHVGPTYQSYLGPQHLDVIVLTILQAGMKNCIHVLSNISLTTMSMQEILSKYVCLLDKRYCRTRSGLLCWEHTLDKRYCRTRSFLLFCLFCLIWFFTSHQQSFSYKGMGLPGQNQY